MRSLLLPLLILGGLHAAAHAGSVSVPDPVYQLSMSGTYNAGTEPWNLTLDFSLPDLIMFPAVGGSGTTTSISNATFTYAGTPVNILGDNPIITSSLFFVAAASPGFTDSFSMTLAIASASADGVISFSGISDASGAMIGQDGVLTATSLTPPPTGPGFVAGQRLLLDEGPIPLTGQSVTIIPIPEPQTTLLALLSLSALVVRRRR